MLSIQKCKGYTKLKGFKNGGDWKRYHKEHGKPNNVPANPQDYYTKQGVWPDSGWRYLTGEVGSPEFLSKKLFFIFCINKKINNSGDLNLLSKLNKRPLDVPSTPIKQYEDFCWKELETFKQLYIEYKQVGSFLHHEGVRCEADFIQAIKEGSLPAYLTQEPTEKFFDVFISWDDFLYQPPTIINKTDFMSQDVKSSSDIVFKLDLNLPISEEILKLVLMNQLREGDTATLNTDTSIYIYVQKGKNQSSIKFRLTNFINQRFLEYKKEVTIVCVELIHLEKNVSVLDNINSFTKKLL
jgi:hypothetical protein